MILVTGGAGYVGSHAVQALKDVGIKPVIFDDFSSGHRDFVGDTPAVEGDIRRPTDLREAFKRFEIEGVIHFAGRAETAQSQENPELYYETNVGGGLNLLNAMRAAGVRHLIFSSSCATYGIAKTPSISEDHPQSPINPYGETKLVFERALEWFHIAHGIEYLALRYFNAAGADADARFGEDHDPETHLIPLVLEAAAGLRLSVTINGTEYPTEDGTCIRDYVHVTDLATAHVSGLQRLMAGTLASQAVNLGTGEGVSVREVINAVRKITGRDFTIAEGLPREGDPPRLVARVERAADLLNWEPEHSRLSNIVETAWNWLEKRRPTG